MFSGYIFDVEGTLVDSVPQNLRSLHEALEEAGIDVPYEALQLYGLDWQPDTADYSAGPG